MEPKGGGTGDFHMPKPLKDSGSSPEEAGACWRELRARGRGDLRHAGGWAGECAWEEWREKKREYNRRYRERHVERLAVFRPIYKARERAKQLGLEQFPLPVWDKESGAIEIPFG